MEKATSMMFPSSLKKNISMSLIDWVILNSLALLWTDYSSWKRISTIQPSLINPSSKCPLNILANLSISNKDKLCMKILEFLNGSGLFNWETLLLCHISVFSSLSTWHSRQTLWLKRQTKIGLASKSSGLLLALMPSGFSLQFQQLEFSTSFMPQ